MAKVAGRAAVLSKAATPIGGVRVLTIKMGAEPIDVTDKDSSGIIELLSVAATKQLTLSVEGVYKDPVLRDIAMTAATSPLITDLTFKFADALTASDTIAGNFFMTSYEEGNSHDDATSFSAEFVSAGTWTLA
jgi:TP901-1 family phage major tail protein